MSYKVQSHSLSEQAANLADVYSSVKQVPLAKAQIRRQARKGLPKTESVAASAVMDIVDTQAEYFGAQTVTPDPRTGSTRVGWWKEGYSPFFSKRLKNAVREAWGQRSLRLQKSDETTRTIKGRSSSDSPSSYELTATQTSFAGGLVSDISCVLKVTPVFSDGEYPSAWQGDLSQDSFQTGSHGVTLTSASDSETFPASTTEMTFTFTVSLSDATALPDNLLLVSAGGTGSFTLKFSLSISAEERPKGITGAPLSGSPTSTSTQKIDLFVDVS